MIIISMLGFSLSGCFLAPLLSTLGGGTSSSEKGHGNDNEVLIGSDKNNGVDIGKKTEVDTDDVGGDVNVGDKSEYNADKIAIGITWWQLIITMSVLSFILIVVAFLVALFMRSPKDRKLLKELKK